MTRRLRPGGRGAGCLSDQPDLPFADGRANEYTPRVTTRTPPPSRGRCGTVRFERATPATDGRTGEPPMQPSLLAAR